MRDLHLDDQGRARMVDVGAKDVQRRTASARAVIAMSGDAMQALATGTLAKGDALAVARIAAIHAAKRTSDLIPLCHPLALDHAAADMVLDEQARTATITVTVRMSGRTGVEMEALTAASVGALAIYDMVKGIDGPAPRITDVALMEKSVDDDRRDRAPVTHPSAPEGA
ncbi:MAG: cyclic pyranopterin monophosphate synthase MoaC [Actinobacteria bacterium]|nr:cyclic pyranopterin monophosphate synthase MoaC [Actinomycetota bacterium]